MPSHKSNLKYTPNLKSKKQIYNFSQILEVPFDNSTWQPDFAKNDPKMSSRLQVSASQTDTDCILTAFVVLKDRLLPVQLLRVQ